MRKEVLNRDIDKFSAKYGEKRTLGLLFDAMDDIGIDNEMQDELITQMDYILGNKDLLAQIENRVDFSLGLDLALRTLE